MQSLLEEGIGWRVGNGRDINIWSETWLPGSNQGEVMGHDININYMLVADLIDTEHNTWCTKVLEEIFDADHTSRILIILIIGIDLPDARIWRGETSSMYFARSGYKWLLKGVIIQQPLLKNFYNNLWSLQLANKIKITLWRIFQNYIPTFTNLQNRKLQVLNACPLCHASEEYVVHLLGECLVCNQILNGVRVYLDPSSNIQEWESRLATYFVNIYEDKRLYFAIACCAIWLSRNKIHHQGEKLNNVGIITFLKAYKSKNDRVSAVTSSTTGTVIKPWLTLVPGVIKCNFDASYNPNTEVSVSGIIFRNNEGKIMVACTHQNANIPDSTMAKAKVGLQVVIVVAELGFTSLALEGDYLAVIEK